MSLQALAHVVVSIGYSPLSGVIVEQEMSKSALPMAMSDAIVGCARETGRPRFLEIAAHIQTPGILYDRRDIFSGNQQSS